ncbi:uncharacterized protein LOC127876116 [Dreissena polymorpha]|uniref:Uncharacterized protein n=3 Tax=Dreissena polymorpha TaxID=45954 RepID=A0A9D4K895_DREPO|nr:uncharacterized protein LOC127876116 [Dreissena polymorpha]KAH3834687.1 hypothetical protein DPMN_108020 [Dreissena polymorpha]
MAMLSCLAIGLLGFAIRMTSASGTCERRMDSAESRIPKGMPIADFDFWVVNRTLGELYYAMSVPPLYIPDINYHQIIKKFNDSYYEEVAIGDTPSSPKQCNSYVFPWIPASSTQASFHRNGKPDNIFVVFSSCPKKYIWVYRCTQFTRSSRCPLSHTFLGLFINEGISDFGSPSYLDDLPLQDMLMDLCPTRVKFGVSEFKWFYSYGANTLCDPGFVQT